MTRSLGDSTVAVVVATHNRASMLEELLAALRAQTVPCEVIVVDDGSTDRTPSVLSGSGVRTVRIPNSGPARARDVGWRQSDARVVAFTDDDCLPDERWLERLVAPIVAGRADVAQGRTVPRSDQLHRMGPWSRTQHVEGENGYYQTCNIAYHRDVLESVGGFRREFFSPRASGEDCDLAWRARKAGFGTTFVADAVVQHAVSPSSYWAFLRDRARWGMIVQVVKLHPEVRALLYRRYFYRPSHVRTIGVLLAGLATALWRPYLPVVLAAATCLAYLVRSRGRRTPVERVLHLARVFVADLVELAVFLVASVRYRTVLL